MSIKSKGQSDRLFGRSKICIALNETLPADPTLGINAVYSLEGTVLENVDNIKYIGVTISKDLSSCPQDIKETVYKGLVRPILEYASLFGTRME